VQVDVEERGVQRRALAIDQGESLFSPADRSNHLGALAFEQELDCLTNPVVVLDDQDTTALQSWHMIHGRLPLSFLPLLPNGLRRFQRHLDPAPYAASKRSCVRALSVKVSAFSINCRP